MSEVLYPDGFAFPAELTPEQQDWLVSWATERGPLFLAKCVTMRDQDADGGQVLAIVVDLPRGRAAILAERGIDFGPFTVMQVMGAPSETFPCRYVCAMEWPRFVALAKAPPPVTKRAHLQLVPEETSR